MAFVEMGGYAAYIWPAFGATTLVLVVLAVASLRQLRSREQTLAGLQQTVRPRRAARGEKGVS
ncbi:MAG: heme exporter protein CcmD [Rhodospirillales bacterium]|nr:heme exporter protein CcmD [Rhodospirillales bacterium]